MPNQAQNEQLIRRYYRAMNARDFDPVADLPGMPATGKPYSLPSAAIGTIEEGKIKTNTDYWNFHSMLTQLGFAPAAGGS